MTVPTLLVRGGRSDVLGPAGVEELCRLIPHAKVEDIAEAHHMVAGDENDAFSAAVLEFLESSPPSRRPPNLFRSTGQAIQFGSCWSGVRRSGCW